METTLKIEHVPHGTVIRNSKNAVFITRGDMKELKSSFKHGEFQILGRTFTTMHSALDNSITFVDIYSGEFVCLKYDEVMELIK